MRPAIQGGRNSREPADATMISVVRARAHTHTHTHMHMHMQGSLDLTDNDDVSPQEGWMAGLGRVVGGWWAGGPGGFAYFPSFPPSIPLTSENRGSRQWACICSSAPCHVSKTPTPRDVPRASPSCPCDMLTPLPSCLAVGWFLCMSHRRFFADHKLFIHTHHQKPPVSYLISDI